MELLAQGEVDPREAEDPVTSHSRRGESSPQSLDRFLVKRIVGGSPALQEEAMEAAE